MSANEIKEELKRLKTEYGLSYILGYVRGLWQAKAINDSEYCTLHLWICDNLY